MVSLVNRKERPHEHAVFSMQNQSFFMCHTICIGIKQYCVLLVFSTEVPGPVSLNNVNMGWRGQSSLMLNRTGSVPLPGAQKGLCSVIQGEARSLLQASKY